MTKQELWDLIQDLRYEDTDKATAADQKIEALRVEHERMRIGLENFRDQGTSHDLSPTHGPGFDWQRYMQSMDDSVRRHARRWLPGFQQIDQPK